MNKKQKEALYASIGLGLLSVGAYYAYRKAKEKGLTRPYAGVYTTFSTTGPTGGVQLTESEVRKKFGDSITPRFYKAKDNSNLQDFLLMLVNAFDVETAIKVENIMVNLQSKQGDSRIISLTNAFMPISRDGRQQNVDSVFGMGPLYANPYIVMNKQVDTKGGEMIYRSVQPDFFWFEEGKAFMGYWEWEKFPVYLARIIYNKDDKALEELVKTPKQGSGWLEGLKKENII